MRSSSFDLAENYGNFLLQQMTETSGVKNFSKITSGCALLEAVIPGSVVEVPLSDSNNNLTTVVDEICQTISNAAFLANNEMAEAWRVEVYRYALPFLLGLFALSAIANTYILVAVYWIRKMSSPNLLFTLSLTLADAWVSLVLGFGLLINSYLPVVTGVIVFGDSSSCFGLAFEAVRVGAMITTIFHLLALACNHYMGIARPLQYLATMTNQTAAVIIAALWSLPPAGFLVYFSVVPGQAFLSENCWNFVFYMSLHFRTNVALFVFVPLLMFAIIYLHIFIIIQKARRLRRRKLATYASAKERRLEIRNLKAVNTTLLVVGTYIFGWIPLVLVYELFCTDCRFPIIDHELLVFWLSLATQTLVGLKCLVNPFIYATRVTEIRHALLDMNAFWLGPRVSKASSLISSAAPASPNLSFFSPSRFLRKMTSDCSPTTRKSKSIAYETETRYVQCPHVTIGDQKNQVDIVATMATEPCKILGLRHSVEVCYGSNERCNVVLQLPQRASCCWQNIRNGKQLQPISLKPRSPDSLEVPREFAVSTTI